MPFYLSHVTDNDRFEILTDGPEVVIAHDPFHELGKCVHADLVAGSRDDQLAAWDGLDCFLCEVRVGLACQC